MSPVKFALMLENRDAIQYNSFSEGKGIIPVFFCKFFSKLNSGINHDRDSITEFLGSESMKTCTTVNLNILTGKYGCDEWLVVLPCHLSSALTDCEMYW